MGMLEIGDGIKKRLQTIQGLRIFSTKELPDTVNQFPAALIMPGETRYMADFSADADYNFRIILLFSKADTPSAISKMLPYIATTGDKSIVAAIEGDLTLDGHAENCKIINNLGIGNIVWGAIPYLSTEFQAQVWAND